MTIGLGTDVLSDVCASCRAPVHGRWVVLSVADSGSGVPHAVRARMFEPFFTTKEVGRGSGMGLAMVHGIVHDHDGHLLVEDRPGGGTRFLVLLPSLAPLESAPPAATSAKSTVTGRVLLVEDEAMVGAFMSELLVGWGLDVTLHADPFSAERLLADPTARIDLVLTDQTMPGMTGLALAQRARDLRPDLPVLLYTGFGEGLDDTEVMRAGVRAVLRKPVDRTELRSALAAALAAPA